MFEGGISHRLTYEELLKLLVEVEAVIRSVYTTYVLGSAPFNTTGIVRARWY
jgi:hypothetical protein